MAEQEGYLGCNTPGRGIDLAVSSVECQPVKVPAPRPFTSNFTPFTLGGTLSFAPQPHGFPRLVSRAFLERMASITNIFQDVSWSGSGSGHNCPKS